MKKENFPAVDIFRVIMAILIMQAHCFIFGSAKYFGVAGILYNRWLSRLTVPYFFICTGFFMGRNDNIEQAAKKNVLKFLYLYIVWVLIYTPINVHIVYKSPDKVKAVIGCISSFFWGSFPLWWLEGTAVAIVIYFIFYKLFRKNNGIILIISTLIYVMGSIYYDYVMLGRRIPVVLSLFDIAAKYTSAPLAMVRNGISFGLVFVTLGIILAKRRTWNKLPTKAWVLLFALSMLAGLGEKAIMYKLGGYNAWMGNTELYLLPAAFCLFCLALSISEWMNANMTNIPDTKEMRTLSGLIFYMHWLVYYFANILLRHIVSATSNMYNLLLGTIVTIVTIVLAKTYIKMMNRFSILKKIV